MDHNTGQPDESDTVIRARLAPANRKIGEIITRKNLADKRTEPGRRRVTYFSQTGNTNDLADSRFDEVDLEKVRNAVGVGRAVRGDRETGWVVGVSKDLNDKEGQVRKPGGKGATEKHDVWVPGGRDERKRERVV